MRIDLKGISKCFGKQVVIPAIDLALKSGSFTTLLGSSGCGKTTLLRMIAGLEKPDSGEIRFDETCIFSARQNINILPEKRGLGFVFQDFALWPHMSVFENVAFGLRAGRRTANLKERVHEALKAVRLDDFAARYPHQLSGGQQQRVAFARAIVIRPKCILFDEPLSALDAILREAMRAELKELVSKLGITAVYVTHDQMEAMSMSDEIVVIKGGNVEQKGLPEEIYLHPATPFVARFIGRSNWIGERRMFRPEALSLAPVEDAEEFRAKIKSVQFVGGGYDLCMESGDMTWLARSPERVSQEVISVFIKPESIVEFSQI